MSENTVPVRPWYRPRSLPDIYCCWFYFSVWSQSFVVFRWIRYFIINCFQLFHASNLDKTIMVFRLRELYFSCHVSEWLSSMSSETEKQYSDADFKEVKRTKFLMRSNWFQEYTSRIINYPGHMAEVFRITNLRIKQKHLSTSAVQTHGLIKVIFWTEILDLLVYGQAFGYLNSIFWDTVNRNRSE